MKRIALISALFSALFAVVGTAQPPRTEHALGFYDAKLGRVVLIGGAGSPKGADRDQVWSWTGTQWELMTASGPAARTNGAAAYDKRQGKGIVAGGMRQTEVVADTWEGNATGWAGIAGTEFSPRDHQSLVYDESRRTVVMFGGIPADRRAALWPADTWELMPTGWQRIVSQLSPLGRARTAMVYDSKRKQVVLFGGVGASPAQNQPQPFFNDTWVWDRSGWRQVTATGGPPGRYAHGMVFDERAGVVLLYSGAAAHRNAPLQDMWQWDGKQWTEIKLSGPTPGYRYQPVMVYDRRRGKTVLYGGLNGPLNDTWEWDGRQWKQF